MTFKIVEIVWLKIKTSDFLLWIYILGVSENYGPYVKIKKKKYTHKSILYKNRTKGPLKHFQS